VRPEALRVATSESEIAENAFRQPATVTGILPTGGSWIIELRIGGEKIFQVMHEAPELTPGTDVTLWIKPKALHVFDKRGERLAAADRLLRPVR
jgi:iron(III) transport system ATP-binding protein